VPCLYFSISKYKWVKKFKKSSSVTNLMEMHEKLLMLLNAGWRTGRHNNDVNLLLQNVVVP
jgi:hypothetical protein